MIMLLLDAGSLGSP